MTDTVKSSSCSCVEDTLHQQPHPSSAAFLSLPMTAVVSSPTEEKQENLKGSPSVSEFIVCDSHELGFQEKIENTDDLVFDSYSCGIQENIDILARKMLKQEKIDNLGSVTDQVLKQEDIVVKGKCKGELEMGVRHGRETWTSLESKKKHLLPEVRGGSSIFQYGNAENVADCDSSFVLNDSYIGIDKIVNIKMELIDGTAPIDSVIFPTTENCNEKNGRQLIDGTALIDVKKPRRSRKKANDVKSASQLISDEQRKMMSYTRNDGNGIKIFYSREEMEALRLSNIAEQRQMWRDIYSGLPPVFVKEYEELAISKRPKNTGLNFDPSHLYGRKTELSVIPREICPQNTESELENTEDEKKALHILDGSCSHSDAGEDAYSYPQNYVEDDDSDEDYANMQRPAFFVKGEPNFNLEQPEDGLEYLRRVRWEAARIPKVRIAKLDRNKLSKEQSVYMPQIPDIANCPEQLLPSKHWEDSFLSDFSDLRVSFPSHEGTSADLQSIFQAYKEQHSVQLNDSIMKDIKTEEGDSFQIAESQCISGPIADTCGGYPILSTILEMDYVSRASMLKKRISSVEGKEKLTREDCVWLFWLCAAVDSPLHYDTSAALRSLLRRCAALRSGKCEVDDEVVMLNILATISGRYFGQSEK